MTEETEKLDSEHIPISRKVESLGMGWAFHDYKKQGDEWKNSPPYHVKVGFDHFTTARHHSDKKFIRIRTGAHLEFSQLKVAQELQKKAEADIKIPVEWGIKGLPVDMAFFEFELIKEKTLEKK